MGGGAGLVTQFPEKWLQTANHPSRYNLSQHVKWKPQILGFAGCCFRKPRKQQYGEPLKSPGRFEFSRVFCRPLGLKLQKKTHRLRILQRHGFFPPKNLDPKAAYAAACSHVVTPSAWKYLGVPGPWSIRKLLPLNVVRTWGAMVSIHFSIQVSIHPNDSALD